MQRGLFGWARLAIRRVRKGKALGVFLLALVTGAGVAAMSGGQTGGEGWGQEAVDNESWNPVASLANGMIRPANACGLGASSCFQCHDGQRASFNDDPETAPWHPDHADVNHSCEGCHNGNPRLRREDMAHRGMLNDPRTDPGEACAGCHTDPDELEELLARY